MVGSLWIERGRRSSQKRPFESSGASSAASQISVSAPWSGVRRSGPITFENVGSDASTPGVSAQPGCIAWNRIPEPRNLSAHISLRVTCARLASAYCCVPLYFSGVTCSCDTVSPAAYIPPEDMVITRDGADAARRSSSSVVNRNGPTTWLATVASVPSAVT